MEILLMWVLSLSEPEAIKLQGITWTITESSQPIVVIGDNKILISNTGNQDLNKLLVAYAVGRVLLDETIQCSSPTLQLRWQKDAAWEWATKRVGIAISTSARESIVE